MQTDEREVISNERSSEGKSELHTRLRLLERQLINVNTNNSTHTPPSTNSVIVSLRWSLLRALEKPLKSVNLPGLCQHGIASDEINVAVQCDYRAFREISDSLAKEHSCVSMQKPILESHFHSVSILHNQDLALLII